MRYLNQLLTKFFIVFFVVTISCICLTQLQAKPKTAKQPEIPELTVIIVIDQFAHHYIKKLSAHLQFGLKDLLHNSVCYTNAYHPHGIPETTPGHHAISTGVLPKDHGAVTNQWLDRDCNQVSYEIDLSPTSTTFSQPDNPACGKSSQNTMVDGLSDQFILKSTKANNYKSFALSLKPYPAIAMANKLGKAIWFDEKEGQFTSSKNYFSACPHWIKRFNNEKKINQIKTISWDKVYPDDSPAYNFPHIKNYDFAGYKFSMLTQHDITPGLSTDKPYDLFLRTPLSSELLLDLAKLCIEKNFNKTRGDHMLLWLSLSNLDLLGHMYGPDSLEVVDMIYQIDKQLKNFMNYLNHTIGEKKYMLVLTADHGIGPIPEIQQLKGLKMAKRIIANDLVAAMNKHIEEKFSISGIVACYDPTSFRVNHKTFDLLEQDKQESILTALTAFLKQYPGIKNAWTFKELESLTFLPTQLEQFYKNQLYFDRIGEIICQPHPYCQVTHYSTGTSHMTPYDYDTHVPLFIYHKGRFEKKKINEKVWIPQLPVTLAKLLHLTRPSASTFDMLPGIC